MPCPQLFTGKYLYSGRTNNQMLKWMQDVRGPFSNKMLRKSQFREVHFEEDFTFKSKEIDPVANNEKIRMIKYTAPQRDLYAMLGGHSGLSEEQQRRINIFKDLLEKMFVLDPTKRISVSNALSHPFFKKEK